MALNRRAFIHRSGLTVVAGIVGPHVLAGCGTGADRGTLERIRDAGFATVGVANEEPYGYFDEDARLTGAAPAVAAAVLQRLGVPEIRGEQADFGGLVSEVEGQRFDLIAAGMFVTTARCEEILFADPEFCALQALAIPAGNPDGFSDYASVVDTDVRIGVLRDSVESEYLKRLEVADERVAKYRRADGLLAALRSGEVSVAALNSIALRRILAQDGDGLEMTDPFELEISGIQASCGAFGFRDKDVAFRDAFNAVLVEMKDGDEILPLVQPFGIKAPEVEAAKGRTADDLCIGAQRRS